MSYIKKVDGKDDWMYYQSGTAVYKKKSQVNGKAYALYFCNKCKHVWEIACSGTILRYKHLPTYGLKRIDCNNCTGKKRTNREIGK